MASSGIVIGIIPEIVFGIIPRGIPHRDLPNEKLTAVYSGTVRFHLFQR